MGLYATILFRVTQTEVNFKRHITGKLLFTTQQSTGYIDCYFAGFTSVSCGECEVVVVF
jgi:hypothetical protein